MKETLLQMLAGTWFVIGSNFPMWLKGDKHDPSFTYTVIEQKGEAVLKDEVKYIKNDKLKTITGVDHPDKNNKQSFTWQGKGLLFIAKSKWQVKLIDEHRQWVVIYFSKTLFTPEGVDIISREKLLSPATYELIKTKMITDSLLKQHVSSLIAIPQS